MDNILDAPSGDKKVMLKANLKRKAGDSESGSDTVGPVELTKGVAGKWKRSREIGRASCRERV